MKYQSNCYVVGNEVLEFARNIGVSDLSEKLRGTEYRGIFKRRNYFVLDNNYLVVKVSRSKIRTVWGIGKQFVDIFNLFTKESGNFFVVTLVSNRSGWVFSKREVNNYIKDGSWSYSENQKQYKINDYNLKDKNSFTSIDAFLTKIRK